jgi:hypothetical protein
MILMHGLRSIFGSQYIRFIMALETFPFGDMSISSNHINMALLTGHPSGDILPMIEIPTLYFNVPFGLNVTRGAPSDSTRDAFLLSLLTRFVIMANKAVGLMDGEVGSLNNLCMAGGASKFYSPPQFSQMPSMGKVYIFKYHIPF